MDFNFDQLITHVHIIREQTHHRYGREGLLKSLVGRLGELRLALHVVDDGRRLLRDERGRGDVRLQVRGRGLREGGGVLRRRLQDGRGRHRVHLLGDGGDWRRGDLRHHGLLLRWGLLSWLVVFCWGERNMFLVTDNFLYCNKMTGKIGTFKKMVNFDKQFFNFRQNNSFQFFFLF